VFVEIICPHTKYLKTGELCTEFSELCAIIIFMHDSQEKIIIQA
jgi:hypothetical protein